MLRSQNFWVGVLVGAAVSYFFIHPRVQAKMAQRGQNGG